MKPYTITMDTPGLLEQIEAQLETPRPDCQIWPGAVDRGYGRVWVDGKAKRVHRVVWELKHGPIPDDLTIDHLCRIRSCANTEHMELVSLQENIARKPAPRLKTHCKHGHEFTPDNTGIGPDGARVCRICRAVRRKRSAERKRAQRMAARAAQLVDTG